MSGKWRPFCVNCNYDDEALQRHKALLGQTELGYRSTKQPLPFQKYKTEYIIWLMWSTFPQQMNWEMLFGFLFEIHVTQSLWSSDAI